MEFLQGYLEVDTDLSGDLAQGLFREGLVRLSDCDGGFLRFRENILDDSGIDASGVWAIKIIGRRRRAARRFPKGMSHRTFVLINGSRLRRAQSEKSSFQL